MSITVVGSVAFDSLETLHGKSERCLGGAATHFSVSASFFTAVKMIGVVGGDFPEEHISFLKSRNIDLAGLEIIPDGKTFFWAGRYGDDVNEAHTLETRLNVFENFKPKMPDDYKNSNILFLANIHPDLQRHVISMAGKPKHIALDTMNLWINTTKESLLKTISLVDIITINDTEVKLLTGKHNMVAGVRLIQQMGPKTVVVKRGEYGAVLFYGDEMFAAPALPLEVVKDPTGAGDTFAGGMMGYLDRCADVNFDSLKTAVICGSVMASFNVTEFGCNRFRELTQEEINNRFTCFESLASFKRMLL